MLKQIAPNATSKGEIGKRLRAIRLMMGMDQGVFAERLGLAQNTYSQYETGERQISVNAANAVIDLIPNVTLDYIFRGETNGMVRVCTQQLMAQLAKL
jgi:transcriptional regulator with XRE-family HTH domain